MCCIFKNFFSKIQIFKKNVCVWKILLPLIFKNSFPDLKFFRKILKFLELFLFCKLFFIIKNFIKKSYKNENLFPNPKN
jgi:hypothetical protein